jgi:hypothetical protein
LGLSAMVACCIGRLLESSMTKKALFSSLPAAGAAGGLELYKQ